MNKTILVTFATIHGSTLEVAQKIRDTLEANGHPSDLIPLHKVNGLDGFSAVILGAPLYRFKWNRDAFHFFEKFRPVFENGLPVAIFAGGPTGKGDEEEWEVVSTHFKKEMAKISWLKPASTLLIGGKFDPACLRFPYNLIPALKSMPPADLRDWPAIQNWALSLPSIFNQTQPVA